MTKVLIIGIDSFTGHYVKDELESAGHQVFGTVYNQTSDSPNLFTLDLFNKEQLASVLTKVQPEVIIHLAGVSFVVQENVDILYTTHILGTRNLLDAAAKALKSINKIILASSAQVYGHSSDSGELEITEGSPTSPKNDYAVSKLAMEHMARLWMDKLPIIITRPFNYTGIGQHERFIIPKLVSAFKEKTDTIELGNINIFRDFSDVRFVAKAYAALMDHGQPKETYNISSGTATSLSEILNMLTNQSQHQVNVAINETFIRKNDPLKLIGSNQKLLSLTTHLKPTPINETLKWMLA